VIAVGAGAGVPIEKRRQYLQRERRGDEAIDGRQTLEQRRAELKRQRIVVGQLLVGFHAGGNMPCGMPTVVP
jgi:hypothetical protein